MKKIIGLTIAAVLIISLVVGGTWAYFTDTETITGNTFTAGTIDLRLHSEGTVFASTTLPDMKPCQTGYLVITLSNDGNNEMHVWKHIVDIDPATDYDENGINEPECVSTEYGGTWDSVGESCSNYTAKNDIDRYIHFDMWVTDTDPIDTNGDVIVPTTGDSSWIIEESDNWLLTTNTTDFTAMPVDPEDGDLDFNGVSCY